MSDLLEELKEDFREEQLHQLWKKYGNWLIGGVVAILAGTAVGIAWQSWSSSKQAEYATTYGRARTIEAERMDEAAQLLEDLAKKSSGFSFLSKMHLASQSLRKRDMAAAEKHLSAIENMGHLDSTYRDLAKLMQLYLSMDSADIALSLKSVEPLTSEKSPWRYLALELKGLLLMKKKDFALAQATFDGLVSMNVPIPAFHHRIKALAQWAKESASHESKAVQ